MSSPEPATPEPKPYHPGSITRDCDQENTQGIARSPWMLRLACREAGRLAMLRSESSLTGLAA